MKSKLSIIFFFCSLFLSVNLSSQNVSIFCDWSAGGEGSDDRFWGIDHVSDDKFVIVGNTNSNGDVNGNIPAFYGGRDAVLSFIDNCGTTIGRYGGGGNDYLRDVTVSADNRIIAVGYSSSDEGHAPGNNGGEDGWIIEFDINTGGYVTSNQIGGSSNERFFAVKELESGGFAMVGKRPSQTNNGDDLWIVRVNESFNDNWQTRIGSLGEDVLYDLAVAPNGDLIVVGFVSGDDGELSSYPLTSYGGLDLVVSRINGVTGAIEWIKTYGGTGEDQGFSIIPTHDEDGYLIVGTSNSSSGINASAFDSADNMPRGDRDLWILRIDQIGDVQWFKRYGGIDDDAGRDIIAVDNGKYTIASYSASNAVAIDFSYPSENRMGRDYWIFTIDESGNAVAGATFGGTGDDEAQALACDSGSNSLVAVGFSEGGGQVSEHYGGQYDGWAVVILKQLVETEEINNQNKLTFYPNPASGGLVQVALPDDIKVSDFSTLMIHDALGRKIDPSLMSFDNGKAEINVVDLTPGIYYISLRVHSSKTHYNGKIMIH